MKVAVVGATGLVGTKMMEILTQRDFPVSELIPVGSDRKQERTISFKGQEIKVITNQEAVEMRPDLALFSAGGTVSKDWAPQYAATGCIVVDNSSAWRMDPDKPLVVPEINADVLSETSKIIANPNCSTIQMVMALAPLHEAFKIKRVVVSTYQSVSGSGMKGISQLADEEAGGAGEPFYAHSIHRNCLPHCDDFEDNGYTKEEMKLVNETKKILRDDSIAVTATAVRVPVAGGHSESVNIEFEQAFELHEIERLLSAFPGVEVQNDSASNAYPMPIDAEGKDEVFVGRIRRDESQPNSLNMWIVADNLRKGAATNAVQIAEALVDKGLIKATDSATVANG